MKTIVPFISKREFFSEKICKKGILSIEAAITIPIFTLSVLSLISLIYVIRIDMKIKEAIYEEAKLVSIEVANGNQYEVERIESDIVGRIGKSVFNSGFIDIDNGGIDFSNSDMTNPEIICISVICNIKIPYDLLNLIHYSLSERVVMHSWIGYRDGLYGYGTDETIVYITKDSQVYHRSMKCSYLAINIKQTDKENVSRLRNGDGKKYKKCKLCSNRTSSDILYVTADGDRYHSSLSCSGLKRNYKGVPIYKVGDKRPCSRCGY